MFMLWVSIRHFCRLSSISTSVMKSTLLVSSWIMMRVLSQVLTLIGMLKSWWVLVTMSLHPFPNPTLRRSYVTISSWFIVKVSLIYSLVSSLYLTHKALTGCPGTEAYARRSSLHTDSSHKQRGIYSTHHRASGICLWPIVPHNWFSDFHSLLRYDRTRTRITAWKYPNPRGMG